MTRLEKAQEDSERLTGVLYRLELVTSAEDGRNCLQQAAKLIQSIKKTVEYLYSKKS